VKGNFTMKIFEEKVQNWMSQEVVSVTPKTSIARATITMNEHFIRRLPVVNDGKLVGIVTKGDLREAQPSDATSLSIWELNYLLADLTVDKIMTRNVLTIAPDAPLIDAAEIMLNEKISGLPVVDDHGRLIGVISESDIFRMVIQHGLEERARQSKS
jgi:CBS domain-containing protein